jgi:peptidoglycan biosynthesis protein MviN/MurJ (putative lipid II flippase)
MTINKILANVFFSNKDTKTPAIGGLISILITQLINFIYIWDYGFIVLGYSLIIGSYVNLIFLLIKVKKDYFYEYKKSLVIILIKVFTILLPCTILLNYISSFEEFWRLGSSISKLSILFLVIILLTLYYYYALKFFKINYKNFKV